MNNKNTFLCAAVIFLNACGGGGTGSEGTTTPPPVTSNPGANFRIAPYEFSGYVLSSTDSLLELTYLIKSVAQQNKATASGQELSCSNGGIIQSDYSQSDAIGLQAGEVISVTFRECQRSEVDTSVSGLLTIEAVTVDEESGKLSLKASMDSLEIGRGNKLTVTGAMDVALTAQNHIETLTLTINNNFKIDASSLVDSALFTLDDVSIVREKNLLTALYTINASAIVRNNPNEGEFTFKTTNPFVGYIGEYPHEGKMTLTSTKSTSIVIDANYVDYSDRFNYTFDGVKNETWWMDFVDGALWSFDDKSMYEGRTFRSDNFAFLGSKLQDAENFPLLGKVELMFSRPVEGIEEDPVYFEPWDWNADTVPARITVEGAIVTLTPSSPLTPGSGYSIYNMTAFNSKGTRVNAYVPDFTASDDATAVISASSYFIDIDSSPTVTVDATFKNGDGVQSVTWIDADNAGLTFLSPDNTSSAIDLTTVADTTTQLSVIAEVMSTSGLTAYASIQLNIIPKTQYILAYVSQAGDWIGQGQSVVYTNADGNFSLSPADNLNHIELSFDSNTWWSLDFAGVQDTPLAVGKYTGATRWPFQSPTTPGLSFSGDGRGCNELYGEFEIYELETQGSAITKLAADWTQYCESLNSPPLHGVVRFNSNYIFGQ